MEAGTSLSHGDGQAAVSEAVQLAQQAVEADQGGDVETAVELYSRAVELIAYGLSVVDEGTDTSELLQYSAMLRTCTRLLPTSCQARNLLAHINANTW